MQWTNWASERYWGNLEFMSTLHLVKDYFQNARWGYSKTFYTGRLRPEVQPLTLSYTIFSEKASLSYTFHWKKAPLSYAFLRRLNR